VTVLDWDSNRYLECFYAVPMVGAIPDRIYIVDEIAKSSVGKINKKRLRRGTVCRKEGQARL
jgi:non-ribosomal peptide synthetase component E (peptide arylation enzyme)